MRVLHLAAAEHWDAAQTTGQYRWSTRGATLDEVGYVHASTSAQLPGVVRAFYADADPTEYVLLVIDVDAAERAGSSVRWERPPGAESSFPHFYGPLPVSAVVAALPLAAGDPPAGRFTLPDLTGLDVASTPPSPS